MKITTDTKVQSSNKEVANITIEFNPNDKTEEGLALMVLTVCDTVRQLLILQEAVQVNE